MEFRTRSEWRTGAVSRENFRFKPIPYGDTQKRIELNYPESPIMETHLL